MKKIRKRDFDLILIILSLKKIFLLIQAVIYMNTYLTLIYFFVVEYTFYIWRNSF